MDFSSLADTSLKINRTENGLVLTDGDMELCGDFTHMLPRAKQSNLEKEMLVKAVRIKGCQEINVIDATAGMGEDSFILAAAGFNVELYEYDPVIAALLEDAIVRAKSDPLLSQIASRMSFHNEDSIAAMKSLKEAPDVILLDPMFPERQKSALVKRKFQLLQQLERPCSNEEELFEAAIMANPKKIVIKRPIKGPYLAGKKPSYSLSGKAIRYDCLVFAR